MARMTLCSRAKAQGQSACPTADHDHNTGNENSAQNSEVLECQSMQKQQPDSIPSSPEAEVESEDHDQSEDQDQSEDEVTSQSEAESEEEDPIYAPVELAEIFLSFYKFLTTLHYDPADLKTAPPSGWSSLSPAFLSPASRGNKSPHVLAVLRRLPYFQRHDPITHYHVQSILVDWPTLVRRTNWSLDEGDDFLDKEDLVISETGETVDIRDMVLISRGYEQAGRMVWLDTFHGRIFELAMAMEWVGDWDVVEYFDKIRREYRELKIIPGHGRAHLMMADYVEEREEGLGDILVEEVLKETDQGGFGCTELDIQFVRQIYRKLGWPDKFRRVQAARDLDVLDDIMDGIREWGWQMVDEKW